MVLPIATLVNVSTVLVGGSIGLLLQSKFPERLKSIVFQAIGLGTLVIGFQMALENENLLILIFSLILGGITGEWLDLEKKAGELAQKVGGKNGSNKFAEGLVTTFVLFCIGSMTILGAIDEGLREERTLLYTKSVLDGFTAIALASYYGKSVLFSVIPLFIFQAGITVLASLTGNFFNEVLVNAVASTGGVLIIGIGLNMLEIKKIKVLNLLPALVFAGLLIWLTN